MVSSWVEAHQVANLAAAQAHAKLGVNRSSRVDVFGAIKAADALLLFRPMPRAFGAYFNEPDARPGVVINAGLSPFEQRQTAGHELGHHWFGHSTRVDQDLDLLDVPQRGVATNDEERVVEAFASWFLMPRGAVMSALRLLGLERPRTALDVYRLSLLLGTCYCTTVRHLPNLRLASQTLARQWFSVPPRRLKAQIDRGAPPPVSRQPQVWPVDERFNDASIVAHPSDRIVVRLAGDANWRLSLPSGFTLLTADDGPPLAGRHPRSHPLFMLPLAEQGRRFVIEVSDVATSAIVDLTAQHDRVDEAATWKLQVQIDGPRFGMA